VKQDFYIFIAKFTITLGLGFGQQQKGVKDVIFINLDIFEIKEEAPVIIEKDIDIVVG
jgi:hypothetical protein